LAAAQYSRRLEQLRRGDESQFGGKSASLGELLAAGIPVPPGFALSTEAYRACLAQARLDDPTADAIRAAAVPPAIHQEIGLRYDELARWADAPEPPVAVRSSAVGEDGAQATFAGQQDTFLWVRGIDRVCDAVRGCWASLYSEPAVSYRARLDAAVAGADDAAAGADDAADERAPAMGVAVQMMVDADISGVMFTCNPVSGDPSMVAINASWGLGVAVVGGEVTPDDYLVSKVTREVVRVRVHDKHVQYVPDPGGAGTIATDVPADRRRARCLDDAALAALVDVGRRVEQHFGSRQDIEWAIARGCSPPEGLFVVQSRPVTGIAAKPPAAPPPASAIAAVMRMFGADLGSRRTGGA
jgi:pyruvate,water dikinase